MYYILVERQQKCLYHVIALFMSKILGFTTGNNLQSAESSVLFYCNCKAPVLRQNVFCT